MFLTRRTRNVLPLMESPSVSSAFLDTYARTNEARSALLTIHSTSARWKGQAT